MISSSVTGRAGEENPSRFSGGGLPRSALRLLVSCLPNIPHQPGDLKGRGAAALVSLTDREPWDFPELICDKCNCRASLLREERDKKAKHKSCVSHLDLVLGRAGGSAAVPGTAPRCCLELNKPGSVHPRATDKPPQGRAGDPAVSLAPLDGAEQGGHRGSKVFLMTRCVKSARTPDAKKTPEAVKARTAAEMRTPARDSEAGALIPSSHTFPSCLSEL